jgi:hypothetical protein
MRNSKNYYRSHRGKSKKRIQKRIQSKKRIQKRIQSKKRIQKRIQSKKRRKRASVGGSSFNQTNWRQPSRPVRIENNTYAWKDRRRRGMAGYNKYFENELGSCCKTGQQVRLHGLVGKDAAFNGRIGLVADGDTGHDGHYNVRLDPPELSEAAEAAATATTATAIRKVVLRGNLEPSFFSPPTNPPPKQVEFPSWSFAVAATKRHAEVYEKSLEAVVPTPARKKEQKLAQRDLPALPPPEEITTGFDDLYDFEDDKEYGFGVDRQIPHDRIPGQESSDTLEEIYKILWDSIKKVAEEDFEIRKWVAYVKEDREDFATTQWKNGPVDPMDNWEKIVSIMGLADPMDNWEKIASIMDLYYEYHMNVHVKIHQDKNYNIEDIRTEYCNCMEDETLEDTLKNMQNSGVLVDGERINHTLSILKFPPHKAGEIKKETYNINGEEYVSMSWKTAKDKANELGMTLVEENQSITTDYPNVVKPLKMTQGCTCGAAPTLTNYPKKDINGTPIEKIDTQNVSCKFYYMVKQKIPKRNKLKLLLLRLELLLVNKENIPLNELNENDKALLLNIGDEFNRPPWTAEKNWDEPVWVTWSHDWNNEYVFPDTTDINVNDNVVDLNTYNKIMRHFLLQETKRLNDQEIDPAFNVIKLGKWWKNVRALSEDENKKLRLKLSIYGEMDQALKITDKSVIKIESKKKYKYKYKYKITTLAMERLKLLEQKKKKLIDMEFDTPNSSMSGNKKYNKDAVMFWTDLMDRKVADMYWKSESVI